MELSNHVLGNLPEYGGGLFVWYLADTFAPQDRPQFVAQIWQNCVQNSLPNDPDYFDAHRYWGVALAGLGRPQEAAAHCQEALRIKPDYADSYNNMGNAFQAQGKLGEAISCHEKALELKPGYANAYNNMGTVFKDQGKSNEAIACYRKAVQLVFCRIS